MQQFTNPKMADMHLMHELLKGLYFIHKVHVRRHVQQDCTTKRYSYRIASSNVCEFEPKFVWIRNQQHTGRRRCEYSKFLTQNHEPVPVIMQVLDLMYSTNYTGSICICSKCSYCSLRIVIYVYKYACWYLHKCNEYPASSLCLFRDEATWRYP